MRFTDTVTTLSSSTHYATIFIAGELSVIKDECRKFCMENNLCVSVQETDYIYTGGSETGASITLINYPRFPVEREKLYNVADALANSLMIRCYQKSCTIKTDTDTLFLSRMQK